MSLRTILSNYGFALQRELFPTLEEELGPLGERYELFVTVLGFVPVEPFLTCWRGLPGRPQADRAALARAFSAKAVFAISTTRALVERLVIDRPRRRLCGWSQGAAIPSAATLSRAFSDSLQSRLVSSSATAAEALECRQDTGERGWFMKTWSATSHAIRRRS